MNRWGTILFLMLMAQSALGQLPAFPGAQGFGRMAQGGRNGSVLAVTNLNDSGPGSLREAVETAGARTIVFRTGGIIELQSELQVTEPFLTIAAQTAPGDGVVLKNFGISIFTHDVIIRGLRIRPADDFYTLSPENRDCITIQEGAHHIMVDHCSFSWAVDENVSLWSGANNVTVQWSIISEALYRGIHPKGPHSMGLLIGDGSQRASIHHCVMAHNNGRNPLYVGGIDLEFINNTVYDWGYSSDFQEGGAQIKADIIGNRWKPGNAPFDLDELPLSIDFDVDNNLGSLLHISGNFWPGGPFLTEEQIAAFGANGALFPATSVMTEDSDVEVQPANEAYEAVLEWAGALHPQRDAVDTRVLEEVADSSGQIIDCVQQGPIVLDEGIAISATTTSIVYSVVDDAIKYSAEGRQVRILSGAGVGQMRIGVAMNTLDAENQIVEAVVDSPWDVVPDATSQFSITALCANSLGGFPEYTAGIPYLDEDNEGMDDAWELANGLNPADASDRNGTGLDAGGYTNLEVYLNGYYADHPTGLQDAELAQSTFELKAYPNPFNGSIALAVIGATQLKAQIFDVNGKQIRLLEGSNPLLWNGCHANQSRAAAGIYFVHLTVKNTVLRTKVILTE